MRSGTRMLGFVFVSAVLFASSAMADLITNGSFEQPNASSGNFDVCGFCVPDSWTLVNGNIDTVGDVAWQAADGRESVDLNGNTAGAISQDFATTTGQTYQVSFALAGNPLVGSTSPDLKTLTVSVGGVSQNFSFDVTSHLPSSMGYVTETFEFVATSTTSTLQFQSTISGNAGPVLDNVRVNPVTVSDVPEPASLVLYGTGLAALLFWRRKRES